jgi:hypothetical protein
MSREQIITDMCMTYRHDYGLDKLATDPPWTAGMTTEERQGLYNTMAQIYDNNIQPLMQDYERLNNGESVVLPKDKDHAEAMVKVGMFYLDQNKDEPS